MNEVTRRQVLADLGIDVWRLRVAMAPEPAPEAAPAPAAGPPAPAAAAPRTRARPSPRPADPTPITLHSVAAPGVLLLVSGTLGRRDRRLVLDLLGAATGDWQGRPLIRPFQWPPALPSGVTAAPAASALRAFVDKDVADHGVAALIHTADLVALLPGPEAWPGCRRHVIDSLPALGQDPAGKRALWRFLSAAAP